MIYLDYAATTPTDSDVLNEMTPLFKENFGNPDSVHAAGRAAAYAVSEAREKVAGILGVTSSEVYFTSGGTEADNWAVQRLASGKALISSIEHAALLEGAKLRKDGYSLIPATSGGIVTAESVEKALTPDTGLVCVMAVNNETGCIQPLENISALCREKGIPLFSDCVQAANLMDLKRLTSCCDAISLSGHKIYGPKGVGALVVKKGVKLGTLIAGGEQERSLRGGTLNVPAIVGFAAALSKAQRLREQSKKHAEELSSLFRSEMKKALGDEAIPDGENTLPCIAHYTFPSGGESLLYQLDLKGLCVSGGAACSGHSALPSHVMLAMGRSETQARRGIRFSFGRETTEEEILGCVRIVRECIKKR